MWPYLSQILRIHLQNKEDLGVRLFCHPFPCRSAQPRNIWNVGAHDLLSSWRSESPLNLKKGPSRAGGERGGKCIHLFGKQEDWGRHWMRRREKRDRAGGRFRRGLNWFWSGGTKPHIATVLLTMWIAWFLAQLHTQKKKCFISHSSFLKQISTRSHFNFDELLSLDAAFHFVQTSNKAVELNVYSGWFMPPFVWTTSWGLHME